MSDQNLDAVFAAVQKMNNRIDGLVGNKQGGRVVAVPAAAGESNTPVIVCVVFIIILVVAVVIGAICYTCKSDGADEITVIDARPQRIQNAREQRSDRRSAARATRKTQQETQEAKKKTAVRTAQKRAKKNIALRPKTKLSSRKGKQGSLKQSSLSRSQRLAKDIAKAKRPVKKSLVGGQVANADRTASGSAGSYKSAPTSGMNMRKISTAVNGSRMADSVPQSTTDETVMYEGSGSRYNKQQIQEGIRNAGRSGRDPSRAIRMNSQGRSLGVRDPAQIVRDALRPTTRNITSSVPCGANPSMQYYDYLQSQQQQQAVAAR